MAFSLMGVCSAIFYLIERDLNGNVSTPLDSLYFVVTVMTTVGLGDIAPVTPVGRFFTIIMMLMGTALYVCFTGSLVASILEIELEHKNKHPNE